MFIHHETLSAKDASEEDGVGHFDVVETDGTFKVIQSDGGMTLSQHETLADAIAAAEREVEALEAASARIAVVPVRAPPDFAALLAFVEQMARMTTPEDEHAAEGAEGDQLRYEYPTAADYRADLDDGRLCSEFATFMEMIVAARKLLA